MKGLPAETDFVVIGTGVAGLRAAIELAAAGRVLVLSKKEVPASHAAAAPDLNDEDEVTIHLQDTISAGDGLCNAAAVKTLIDEAPERIEELIAWSKHFDHSGSKLVFVQEATHSHSRVLHAQGESTASEVLRTLVAKAHSLKHISFAPFAFTTALLTDAGRVTGISLLDDKGVPQEIACSAVLLATGGMGRLYRDTTNSEMATADGVGLAYRAGAEIGDMEFVHFHPTALYMKKVPRFLLSEALRTEGAYLRNFEMNRFMAKYHPMGVLAPSDLVARAIVHEMEVSRAKDPFVYLDLTHLNATKVRKHLPRVYEACMKFNVDITEDLIPVRPAAHFCLGGVRADLNGQTNIAGLFAAGETATMGVHGANRFPSNSLLESVVYGARAGRAMREQLKQSSTGATPPKAAYANGPVDTGVEELITQIQNIMWNDVGIVRTRVGMQKAVNTLTEIAPKLANPRTRRAYEAANLHLAALLVARSALAREESRGAHYRMDYSDRDDKKFLRHSVVRGEAIRFV